MMQLVARSSLDTKKEQEKRVTSRSTRLFKARL